ncbi:hypothetical protein NFI96_025317, partial [Prochilodus magdalenae]
TGSGLSYVKLHCSHRVRLTQRGDLDICLSEWICGPELRMKILLVFSLFLVSVGGGESRTVRGYPGGGVLIRCRYDRGYTLNPKYFCIAPWPCRTKPVWTGAKNEWVSTGRFSLLDNTSSAEFWVMIRDLTVQDSGTYKCAVDKILNIDVYTPVELTVEEDLSYKKIISVSGHVGGGVAFSCKYPQSHRRDPKFFCRRVGTADCIDSRRWRNDGRLHDDGKQAFTVNINNLTEGDSGEYWCGAESDWTSDDGYKVYITQVNLRVTELEAPTTTSSPSSTVPQSTNATTPSTSMPTGNLSQISSGVPTAFPHASVISAVSVTLVLLLIGLVIFILGVRKRLRPQETQAGCRYQALRYLVSVFEPELKMKILLVFSLFLVSVGGGESRTVRGYPGGGVLIRCRYDRGYTSNPKYLCTGAWPCMTKPVWTNVKNEWASTGRFSLLDNTSSAEFWVMIRDLTVEDSGTYKCAVDIYLAIDVYTPVELTVEEGDVEGQKEQEETSVEGQKEQEETSVEGQKEQEETSVEGQKEQEETSVEGQKKQEETSVEGQSGQGQGLNILTQFLQMLFLQQAVQTVGFMSEISPDGLCLADTVFGKSISESGYVGGSMNISCKYPQFHSSDPKFLCRRVGYVGCAYKTAVNENRRWITQGKFAPHDDRAKRIFTVSITDLSERDSGEYWCGAESDWTSDDGYKVYITQVNLKVTAFPASSVITGGSVVLVLLLIGLVFFIVAVRRRLRSPDPDPASTPTPPVGGSSNNYGGPIAIYGNITDTRRLPDSDAGVSTVCRSAGLPTKPSDASEPVYNNVCLPTSPSNVQDPIYSNVQCAVDKAFFDVYTPVELTVEEDPSYEKNISVIGHVGGGVNINCTYPQSLSRDPKFLCRRVDTADCNYTTSVNESRRWRNEGRLSLHDDGNQTFTVSINSLTEGDSGEYWCGAESDWTSDDGYRVYITQVNLRVTGE